MLVFFLAVASGNQSREQARAEMLEEPLYAVGLVVLCMIMVGFSPNKLDGKDLLILDEHGLTVVDQRWVRFTDASFSLPWSDLKSIRVIAAQEGSSRLVEVRFKHTTDAETWVRTQDERVWRQQGRRYIVAVLPLSTGRTALVPTVRSALARYAGGIYLGDQRGHGGGQ
ncbi:hypothetical protein [Nocardiopsis alba]|uniref:hypothetical protein n=1 Tax=Nocardiopsis alba TaxID=53437 RepID=UPI00363B5FC8